LNGEAGSIGQEEDAKDMGGVAGRYHGQIQPRRKQIDKVEAVEMITYLTLGIAPQYS
jgi:hypothetical protein